MGCVCRFQVLIINSLRDFSFLLKYFPFLFVVFFSLQLLNLRTIFTCALWNPTSATTSFPQALSWSCLTRRSKLVLHFITLPLTDKQWVVNSVCHIVQQLYKRQLSPFAGWLNFCKVSCIENWGRHSVNIQSNDPKYFILEQFLWSAWSYCRKAVKQ